jgi:dTDP-4-amino-4,6-dideoxygalactose transaminase
MTDLQAALALPQLAAYPSAVAARQANARTLSDGLGDLPGVVVPPVLPGRGHVWHQYTIRLGAECGVSRDQVVASLTSDGIGCGVYYPGVIADHGCYRNHPRIVASDTPVARRCASEVVSLPVHPRLSADDLDQIIAAVRRAVRA